MPNLFKTLSSNRSTTVYSLVVWLGLTLAILGMDAGAALAKTRSSESARRTPAPEPVTALGSAESELSESETAALDQGFQLAADMLVPSQPSEAPQVAQVTPANNEFQVPPGITDRQPPDTAPGQPLPPAPPDEPGETEPSDRSPSEQQPAEPDTPLDAPRRDEPGESVPLTSGDALGEPITTPILRVQGAYILQGDEDTIRGRLLGVYPLEDWLQIGAVVDVTDDGDFNVLEGAGVDLTELYVAAAPFQDLPNLRFVVGQIDFTSYFDRNSFAKDRTTHFFNSVFQSNPALQATTFTSRPGALFNWTITDNIEVKAGAFSSEPDLGDFAINGFVGEVGLRLENFIIRGTYTTSLDGGTRTSFDELFSVDRGNNIFGTEDGDREDAYGINAEYYIPEIGLGLFGRYGHYTNQDVDGENTADTYSFGVNALDLFLPDDRLGLGYGRKLSNSDLRDDDETPDVVEIFYDVRVTRNLRVGVTFQALDEFSESIAGFRIRTDFDLIPRRRTL
jgi:hypothetical protein